MREQITLVNSRLEIQKFPTCYLTCIDSYYYAFLQTMYVMMDGAPVNRSLAKDIQKKYGGYTMPNPNTKDGKITFIMDPKVSTRIVNKIL